MTNLLIYRYIEVKNRNAGKLPPAFGKACMLYLDGNTGPGPFTENRLFAPNQVLCAANSPSADPKAHTHGPGCDAPQKSPADDNDDNYNDQGHGTSINVNFGALPPMLPDATLAKEISSLRIATVDEWRMDPKAIAIFKLFALLMNPPQRLDLDSLPGLSEYLTTLCDSILKLPANGVRFFASHRWAVLYGECFTSAYAHKP